MMQAVILCAGSSTRTYPLTVNKPKALLKVMNKTLLEHNLEQLEGLADEAVIVVGFKKKMIKEFIGNSYKKIKIRYAEQKEQLGTGHALLQAKDMINDRFVVLMGDYLYSKKDIESCLRHEHCVLAKEVNDPEKWGILSLKGNFLGKIDEKPKNTKAKLANTGLYVLDKEIFSILENIKKSERNEIELIGAVNEFAKNQKVNVKKVKDYWLPIGYPWHLLEANAFFLNKIEKTEIKGTVEKNAVIKGNVIIGKDTVIKSGTYIEGPVYIGENCVIGPNAYIRTDTTIGDNCKIRAEVYDAIIMENTTAKHFSYMAHSVIGENVNIAAGVITADYRHDAKSHITLIKGKKVDTGRRKLGAFIGDDVKTGIGTLIYPGRKIWPGKSTLPGEIVKKDIE